VNAPPDFALFLGRLHPLLVHLPIGLIILLATLEGLSRLTRFRLANSNAGYILALAVPTSICTAICGWLLSWGGGYQDQLLQWHKWSGVGTAAICLLTAVFYLLNLKKAYRVSLFGSLALLTIASHFGGSLTHGSDYLTRYAPEPLRGWLAGTAPIAKVQNPQAAGAEPTAHAALVKPILDEYCISCHGPEKSKGGLRLDSFEAVMKGGKGGLAVIAGKPSESDMIKRLSLPLASDDHMPPDGKPQPGPDDLTLLKWWIENGASGDKKVSDLKPNPKLAGILAKRLGATPATGENIARKGLEPKPREQAATVAASLASELGLPITALSEQEPWFQCNASVTGGTFDDKSLAKLSQIAPNLRWLDLGGTAVTDAGLTNLSAMQNLTRLHLERTAIGDEGLAALRTLEQLEYLNLYGTKVSEAGLENLRELPKLRQLYLWQTQVTPEAAKAFADARTDKDQLHSWEQEIEALKAKIRDSHINVELGVDLTPKQAAAGKPINTECPVSGKPVNPEKTLVYEGKVVAFCCDDCKANFQKDPKPFLAKLEPFLKAAGEKKQAAINTVCPVSGKPVNPEKTVVYEGKVVAFCCDDCKANFQKDPAPYLSKLAGVAETAKPQ
jgi:YHS domain-containing protein/uncharacterized membrane protein